MAKGNLENTLTEGIDLQRGSALLIASDPAQRKQVFDSLPRLFGWKGGKFERIHKEWKDAASLKEISNLLMAQSLFQQQRLVLILLPERASSIKLESITQLIEQRGQQDFLLFYSDKIGAKSPLKSHFIKSSSCIELKELKGEDLIGWTAQLLRQSGLKKVDNECIKLLVELSDYSMGRLTQMVEQLSLYVENDRCATSDIMELFFAYPDPNEFILFDLIRKGDLVGIEKALQEIFQSGKSEFLLLALLSKILTNYLLVRRLVATGKRSSEIAERLGMKPWSVCKALESTKGIPLWRLEQILFLIVASDSRLKSTSVGPQEFLGDLLWRLHP